MSKKYNKKTKSFLRFCTFFIAILTTAIIKAAPASAEAVTTYGLVTDTNNVRWEYQLDDEDDQQTVYIRFYDKPSDATTIVVPSLSEVLNLVPNANANLDTYFLDSADTDFQNTEFSDSPRREASVDTTKLDMTNTSKIQIIGVQPIINPEIETELVFGSNMVIGDKFGPQMTAVICDGLYHSWTGRYYCDNSYSVDYPIPGFNQMTPAQRAAYEPKAEDINCELISNVTEQTLDESKCYIDRIYSASGHIGVFSGYKLELTNFDGSNFNYVGWEAFAHSTISGESITISGDAFAGSDIFKNTNLKNVTIETNNIGAGVLRDNKNLETITYASNVTRVSNEAFAGTNLTTFDFSNTNIKTIGPRAFDSAKLTSVNLEGVERIEWRAFRKNDIQELYLPRSINYLQAELFRDNGNMRKLTVAYDTMTSGTTLPMFVVLDNYYGASKTSGQPSGSIEELVVIAPYGENDEVSSTHITYDDYKWHYNAYDQRYQPECPEIGTGSCNGNSAAGNDYVHAQYGAYESNYYFMDPEYRKNYRGSGSDFEKHYAHVDTYKNVIAPIYFANMLNMHNITIGEGYEFIGASAFQDWSGSYNYMGHGPALFEGRGVENTGYALNMPDSLRGIGNGAFVHKFQDSIDFTIPHDIEFIGINAFFNTYFYDKDVDFPNLVALGDHAFEKTRAKNVHLYDKLQYMGAQVFADCLFLNDITFDLDVFDPDIYIAWALPHRHGPEWYDGQFHITTEFGPTYPYSFSNEEIQKYGLRVSEERTIWNGWPLQLGTITFTNKNVSQLPNGYHNCYYFDEYTTDSVTGCPGGYYGTGIYNTFFGHLNADKIDIGETAWKVLSPRMFVQTNIGQVVLPKNLEVIPGDTFSDSVIKEELILPDSIKVIGDAAFNFGQIYNNSKNWSTGELDTEYLENHTIHITKLPSSLEYLGNDAFWGDYGLTADLNSPNLRHVGYKVFWGTRLRDVTLPSSVKSLHAAAFANIPTLRNITIDFDLGALPPNYDEGFNPNDFPQSARDFAGANLYQFIHMSCSAKGMANSSTYPVTTFYSLFNQNLKGDQYDNDGNRISFGQKDSKTHFGKVTFTENAKTDIYMTGVGYFSGLEFDELDLGASGLKSIVSVPFGLEDTKIGKLTLPAGLESLAVGAFENAEIEQPFAWPSTLKTIGVSAFQWTKGQTTNSLPEGLETIGYGAFYAADLTDDLVIPSTVTSIGYSAFNAGDADVHYNTVTIRPSEITYEMDNNQLIHQMLWRNDIDKLVIDSTVLPALAKQEGGEELKNWEQEFWNMPMSEVVLNNLRGITRQAFVNNTNLEKVDASKNANLRHIDEGAFLNDEKLHIFQFSPAIKNETVNIGQYAFEGTAFETIGNQSTDFDLTAAKFRGLDGYAFSKMPKLRTVDIPDTFSNATVPEATFANDEALTEATISYKTTLIDNAAFSNDNKLEKIFIWGNTVVRDENLEGYVAPESGFGGDGTRGIDDDNDNSDGDDSDDEEDEPTYGPTIPEGTDIYAYSANVTKDYAAADARESFEGVFYPLDEVLYLTSNKPRVLLNEDESDFDKSDLVVYGLRRDGVILQSDSWGEFDGVAYPRGDANIVFEKMDAGIEADPVAGAVYDTPVPIDMLSLANENFENIDFELIRDPDNEDVQLVNIIYTDAYTGGQPDTDIDPYAEPDSPTPPPAPRPPVPTPEPEPEPEPEPSVPSGPITFVKNHFGYVIILAACSVILVIALKKRKQCKQQ